MVKNKEDNAYQQLLSPDPVSVMPHPEEGNALMDDKMVEEKAALQEIVKVLLKAKKPVIFTPGRIILWTWEEGAPEKARVVRKLAAAIGAEILPIMDVRPNYPQTRTATEINPYHGDLVIGHNKYDVVVFIGVECAYADVALKIIKDGTDIHTIALCAHKGHVDAKITLCKSGLEKLEALTALVNEAKNNK
jgi:CO dehydrogenase/acetyl-CoA synthase epsilon subunit